MIGTVIETIRSGKGLIKGYALGVILNITISDDTCCLLIGSPLGFYQILVGILQSKSDSHEIKSDALRIIWNLISHPDFVPSLFDNALIPFLN